MGEVKIIKYAGFESYTLNGLTLSRDIETGPDLWYINHLHYIPRQIMIDSLKAAIVILEKEEKE